MMSNPSSSLQNRQKLHRRQNSTPVAFEAMKMQMPPNTMQRQAMHRRGQSFDVNRSPIRRHQHTGSVVSMHTNIGQIQGQQILREAQQQRIARPGQQPIQPRVDTVAAQHCGGFQQAQSLPGTPFDMTMNTYMPSPQGTIQYSQFQNLPMPMSAGQNSPYMFDENSQHYFQSLHQLQEAPQMMPQHDRRMSQPDLRIQTAMRPFTPTHQIQIAHFPLTPAQTPIHQQHFQQNNGSQVSSGWQQNDSILSPRPVSMQKSRSLQGIAEHQEVQSFAEVLDTPSFPASEPSQTTEEPTKSKSQSHAKNLSVSSVQSDMKPLFGEVSTTTPRLEDDYQPTLSSSKPPSSPNRPALSPRRMSISDLHLDPEISASIQETNISVDDIAQFIEGPDAENKWVCTYEGCNKKFGRKENIKSHVQTHLGDRQFRCNHCDKCFVRGHDLKRHAKIHTGAKAYACLCGNAFARHDALTRHRQRGMCIGAFEGIVRKEIKRGRPRKHRPEMDERLDKATRSRARKQEASDGQYPGDMYNSSASSCSISSWGSPPTETMDNLSIHGGAAQSPAMKYDETMDLFGFSSQGMVMSSQPHLDGITSVALHPDMFSFTPPASPDYSTGNKPSPFYRELTPAEVVSFDAHHDIAANSGRAMADFDLLPPQCTPLAVNHLAQRSPQRSPRRSPQTSHSALPTIITEEADLPAIPEVQESTVTTSQALSLPSLSHSSSPPPQESTSNYAYDFADEMNPLRMSTMSNMSFGLSAVNKTFEHTSQTSTASEDHQRNEFDSFLDYNDDSQMSLGMGMGIDNSDAFFASL